MGIGKTTIAFAVHHLQYLINRIHHFISRQPSGVHYLPNLDGPCPHNDQVLKRYGLDCVCWKESPTYGMEAILGVTMAIIPRSLISNWTKEWKDCHSEPGSDITKESNPYDMRLCVAHNDAKGDNRMTNDMRDVLRSATTFGAPGEHPLIKARLENSRVFCLTTAQSFKTHVRDSMKGYREWSIPQPSSTKWNPKKKAVVPYQPRDLKKSVRYVELVFAHIWRDEAHLHRLPTSSTMGVLNDGVFGLPHYSECHLNIMSGTLLTTGPKDIAAYLKIMGQRAAHLWEQHDELRKWTKGEMDKLGQSWDKNIKLGTIDDEFTRKTVAQMKPLVETMVLRFTPESNFLGTGPVVTLPPNFYSEIACRHSREWTDRLTQQRAEEDAAYDRCEKKRRAQFLAVHHGKMDGYVATKRDGATLHYRARLFASFPWLMDMPPLPNGDSFRFTEQEYDAHKEEWTRGKPEAEPYFAYIHEIAASSAKLDAIRTKILQWRDHVDPTGRPACQVFCSFFFVGARIIWLVSNTSSPPLLSITHTDTMICSL